MRFFSRLLRPLLRPLAVLAMLAPLALGARPAAAIPAVADTTWLFTGVCEVDCVGTATATLVLRNYVPGTATGNPATVVSFNYSSSFTSFAYNSANPGGWSLDSAFIQLFGSSVFDHVELSFVNFTTEESFAFASIQPQNIGGPFWCAETNGFKCNSSQNADFGTNFDIALQTPEPATLALLGAGLAGLGAIRRRRAKA